ncbi:MAG: carbohydrate ABC transporter permease [Oscillospiraceae bacterium]|nr:carbohydrate ABC transporter permease [Oscillospiraceae bacterium]
MVKIGKAGKNIFLVLLAALFFLPVFMTVGMSFLDNNMPTFQNYADLLFDCFVFYPVFWNSVLYAAVITIIGLLVIIPAAFGFSHAKFKGKGALFIFYIILMMMPLQVTILPNYIGLRDLGLINTRLGIILPACFSPFGVVVMSRYMQSINNSVIEAMRMETNSVIKIIFHAVIPQIRICIFAVVLFVFADCWNMLEQPLLFLRDINLQTLPVFLSNTEKYAGSVLFPAAVLFMFPVLLLYNFFSDSLEKGLTFGDLS